MVTERAMAIIAMDGCSVPVAAMGIPMPLSRNARSRFSLVFR